jgi:hypothetical protein
VRVSLDNICRYTLAQDIVVISITEKQNRALHYFSLSANMTGAMLGPLTSATQSIQRLIRFVRIASQAATSSIHRTTPIPATRVIGLPVRYVLSNYRRYVAHWNWNAKDAWL